MAKFTQKFKELLGLGDEYEYEDEYYDDYEDYEDEDIEVSNSDASNPEESKSYSRIKRSNIVSLKESDTEQVKIMVHEPISFDDAPNIIDDILSNRVVVLNLEMLEMDVKRQVFDFVSGGIYSLSGKMQKVTKDIFVIAPRGIEIDGKVKDQIQAKGFYQL